MNTPYVMVFLAASAPWATACNLIDDEPGTVSGDETGGISGAETCAKEFEAMLELGCPPGSYPWQDFDGGTSTIVQLDDPGARVGLGVGLVVHFGGGVGADWVGYHVTQNATCSTACLVPSCPDGQFGCLTHFASGETCGLSCSSEEIDQQACNELELACLEYDASAEGTAGDDGGLDETGGGETGEGVADEPYDCSAWHPESIQQPLEGDVFHIPQTLVDQLILDNAETLAECDGVRLRLNGHGHWMISKMRSTGLLGALGLRAGDELDSLDDVELDSLDALVEILGRFVDEEGNPRRFAPSHPGFTLRVRRGERDLQRVLRVVSATDGSLGQGR